MAALIVVAVWLYETSPSVPSLSVLWTSESAPVQKSPEPVADTHPQSPASGSRQAAALSNAKNDASSVARDARPDVLTVVATPPAARVDRNPASPAAASRTTEARPGTATLVPSPASATVGSGSAVAFIASSHIYSVLDEDVTPPETVRPQKLGNLKTGTLSPDDKVTIEVVVNDRGFVEAAWGRTAPRTVGESLLLTTSLHAVKSWAFWPARKDGIPVAYRKLITFQGY